MAVEVHRHAGSLMEIFYLLVCVAGLSEFKIPDICQIYTMQPQVEMTEAEQHSKVIFICEQAKLVAVAHGGSVTKCEVRAEFPDDVALNAIEVWGK